MSKYLEFRNVSTIITSILLTVFGLLLGYLSSIGFDLPVTADVLATVCGGLILFVFSYYNAKNHNTFFDTEKDILYIPADNLSDIQIEALNSVIEDFVEENTSNDCSCDDENDCDCNDKQ